MSSAPARDGGTEEGGLSDLLVRAALVFVAPGRLFEELRGTPAWAGMLAVVVVLGLLGAILIPEEITEQAIRSRMEGQATEAEVQQAVGWSRPAGYVFSVVGPPIAALALAGLLAFVYTLVLGGRAEFRQLFAASVHAWLIPTIGGLVVLPVMVSAGDPEVRLALDLLVPGLDTETYAYRLLHGLNVFSLWTAVVLGVAVDRLYDRRSAGAAAALLVGLYVAFKAVVALVSPV